MQPAGREMLDGGGGGGGVQDDFFDQMLSTLPTAWAKLGSARSPWELPAGGGGGGAPSDAAFDDSAALLASRMPRHQIGGGEEENSSKSVMLRLSDLHRQGLDDGGFLPLPLFTDRSREDMDAAFKPANAAEGDQGLYSGFGATGMHAAAAGMQQPFGQVGSMPVQSFGGGPAASGGSTPSPAGGGGSAPPPPRQQRVRARRGQATDPHSIAERLRRERIAERMKGLQEMVPNANKTDKASMLDEIIDYVKFLQLQVKVLSMSRLGGAAAVSPLVANMSSESNGSGNGTSSSGNGNGNADNSGNTLRATEQQVAKLMEEDMGTAMQYLQGKGLCLMPISLASVISSATSSSLLHRPLHEGSSPTPPLSATTGTGGNDSRTITETGAVGEH